MKNNEKKNSKVISLILYFVLVAVLTQLDQITKIIAVNKLSGQKDFPLIKGVLEFTYIQNTGAAWGMLSGQRIFFLLLTVIIVMLITYIVIRMPFNKKYMPLYITCVLVVSGALGNFIDRLTLAYVRDFIYFKIINFPVFNVADIYVTVSVILFIILLLFIYRENDFDFLKIRENNKEGEER